MKKIFYILSICVMTILQPSCDALDLAPEDYYGAGNFWKEASQPKAFMLGLHAQLRSYYDMFYTLGELRGGTQRVGTSSLNTSLNYADIRSQNISEDIPGISNWNGLYSPIMQVNHFIQEVENGCTFLDDATQSRYLGQAYGMRALYYFMLYRTFGGVPLITKVDILDGKPSADKFYVERATPEATMEFIKADINKSENYFGNNTSFDAYDWSRYATLMLKAEIYMWAAKVSITGFTATFLGQAYGRNGKVIEKDTLNLKGTGGVFRDEYTEDFWKTFKEGDSRRDATFMEYYMKNDNGTLSEFGCVMKKRIGTINSNDNRIYISDIPVYRYADALLMMAEIENGLNNPCASYINEVRKRAYGDTFEENKYTEGSYAENELAILQERDKEFVSEGKRWFDVLRMHDASGRSLVFSANANYPGTNPILGTEEAYKMLWPVNIGTLNVNPLLTQTPGYGKK